MKRTFLLMCSCISFTAMQAQIKEGTIVYEQKTNLHKSIQDEQMKAMMPEFRTSKFTLSFSDSVSMYKAIPEDEAPDPFGSGGGGPRIIMRMGGGTGDLYKNLSQARSVQASEIGGKNFLITDSIKQQPWKIGTETKQILGYTCHKATRKITQNMPVRRVVMNGNDGSSKDTTTAPKTKEVDVVAWYADDLISPVGPENYGQLPGVILQLDVDNSTNVYNAVDIKKSVDQKELKEPKKGKVVTKQEFNKIMMDMMGAPGGGGGMVRFGGG